MKQILLVLLFLLISISKTKAQNYVFGKVISEDQFELNGVAVTNIYTKETTISDSKGNFMIAAKTGEELRFTRTRYYRNSLKINNEHFEKSVHIVLKTIPQEIEEVKIEYQVTGALEEDVKHFGKSKKLLKLENDLSVYMKQKSSPQTLAPRRGEFVQPVGPGISFGKVRRQWNDIDLMDEMIKAVGEDFFIKDLKLTKPEIQNFMFYVLRDFDRRNILQYGEISPADLTNFIGLAQKKIVDYRNNVPVSKEKRLIFKY